MIRSAAQGLSFSHFTTNVSFGLLFLAENLDGVILNLYVFVVVVVVVGVVASRSLYALGQDE